MSICEKCQNFHGNVSNDQVKCHKPNGSTVLQNGKRNRCRDFVPIGDAAPERVVFDVDHAVDSEIENAPNPYAKRERSEPRKGIQIQSTKRTSPQVPSDSLKESHPKSRAEELGFKAVSLEALSLARRIDADTDIKRIRDILDAFCASTDEAWERDVDLSGKPLTDKSARNLASRIGREARERGLPAKACKRANAVFLFKPRPKEESND